MLSVVRRLLNGDAPDRDRPAIILSDRTVSWQELGEITERRRDLLRGLKPGDLVRVVGDNWLWLPTLLAVWASDACYMPQITEAQNTDGPQPRVSLHLPNAAADHTKAVWHDRTSEKLEGVPYLFPTSGTSGTRKWVRGNSSGLENFIDWEIAELAVTPDDVFSQLTPPTFDPVLRDALVPLCAGAAVAIPENRPLHTQDAEKALAWLAKERVTVAHAVPTLARLWCASGKPTSLPNLRALLLAGEPVFARDVRAWQRKFGRDTALFNLYGSTETTLATCFQSISTADLVEDDDPIPVGRAIPRSGVLVMVGDRVCFPYETGEVLIRTPFASTGYWPEDHPDGRFFIVNRLDASDDVPVFRTRDMGYMLPDGRLVIEGRLDDEFKFRGVRINLRSIEDRIRGVVGVLDAAVKIVTPRSGAAVIAAFVVCDVELEVVRRSADFGHGPVPSAWMALPALPKTTSGKIDRLALPDPHGVKEIVVSASDPRLAHVLRIFGSIFPYGDQITPRSGFSELGGQSIEAIQLLTLLETQMGVRLGISDLLDLQTPERLAVVARHEPQMGLEDLGPEPVQAATSPLATCASTTTPWVPLTAAQERFWEWMKKENDPSRFQFLLALQLTGDVDVERLCSAVRGVLQDAAPQWVRLAESEAGPVQARTEGRLQLDVVDLRTVADALGEAREHALRIRALPFDLDTGPLTRARVYVLDEKHVVLALVNHVLASDGWTKTRMLAQIAERFRNGAQVEVNQGRFFAHAVAQHLGRPRWDAGDIYWSPRWDAVAPLALPTKPTGHGRPQSFDSKLLSFSLDPVAMGLDAGRRMHSVSTPAVLIAALTQALQVWSGQRDVYFLLSNARRTDPTLNDVLGCFTDSTLFTYGEAVNSDWTSVARVAASVNENLSEDRQGFLWAARRYRPDLDPFSPLQFPIIFAPQNDYAAALDLPAGVSELPWAPTSWIWPLEVYPVIGERDVRVHLNYAVEYFQDDDMVALMALFERSLNALSALSVGPA